MEITLPGGRYVVAVSGGVDSVVLLHMLAGQRAKDKRQSRTNSALSPQPSALIIAHFDHGIRLDSVEDRKLVQKQAKQYGLPFVYDRAELGAGASEATAREARYAFLRDWMISFFINNSEQIWLKTSVNTIKGHEKSRL